MTAVLVFDPAMCCSTGICGPSVDPQFVRFAADLDWLPDPSTFTGSHEEKLARVIEARERLRTRIESWLATLSGTNSTPRTTTRN